VRLEKKTACYTFWTISATLRAIMSEKTGETLRINKIWLLLLLCLVGGCATSSMPTGPVPAAPPHQRDHGHMGTGRVPRVAPSSQCDLWLCTHGLLGEAMEVLLNVFPQNVFQPNIWVRSVFQFIDIFDICLWLDMRIRLVLEPESHF